jgi:hypothetical protein
MTLSKALRHKDLSQRSEVWRGFAQQFARKAAWNHNFGAPYPRGGARGVAVNFLKVLKNIFTHLRGNS